MLFYCTNFVLALYCLNLDYIVSFFTIAAELDVSQTYFPSLQQYHVNAKLTTTKTYPWIARVVHSRTTDIPHMCTGVCVKTRIFIAPVRCIYNLKVQYTSVIYQSKQMPVRAFVISTNLTSQAFDDIGFVIAENIAFDGTWEFAKLFDTVNRTDEAFEWFKKIKFNDKYKVIGYAATKSNSMLKLPETRFSLTELSIEVNMMFCSLILTNDRQINGFDVPCYHSCSLQEFSVRNERCNNYHGVEGGVVYNTKDKKVLGLATWGAYFNYYELPVGFSVLNSDDFYENFECAKKILNAKVMKSYGSMC